MTVTPSITHQNSEFIIFILFKGLTPTWGRPKIWHFYGFKCPNRRTIIIFVFPSGAPHAKENPLFLIFCSYPSFHHYSFQEISPRKRKASQKLSFFTNNYFGIPSMALSFPHFPPLDPKCPKPCLGKLP